MGNVVYTRGEYSVYQTYSGYVVHNTKKPFDRGHSHLRSFKMAKYVADMAFFKRIPKHLNRYLLVSLARISSDINYYNECLVLSAGKRRKKESYYNRRKEKW